MAKYGGSERLEKMKVWRPGKIVEGKRVKGHYRQIAPSPLGMEIADILGQVWRGLCHLDEDKIDWENDSYIEVNIVEDLSTWDFNRLTELVVLCHDRAVRMSIHKCNFSCLKLVFHWRAREGGITDRHPTMEEAVTLIRDSIGLRIVKNRKFVRRYLCDCGAVWGAVDYDLAGDHCDNCYSTDTSKVIRVMEGS